MAKKKEVQEESLEKHGNQQINSEKTLMRPNTSMLSWG